MVRLTVAGHLGDVKLGDRRGRVSTHEVRLREGFALETNSTPRDVSESLMSIELSRLILMLMSGVGVRLTACRGLVVASLIHVKEKVTIKVAMLSEFKRVGRCCRQRYRIAALNFEDITR